MAVFKITIQDEHLTRVANAFGYQIRILKKDEKRETPQAFMESFFTNLVKDKVIVIESQLARRKANKDVEEKVKNENIVDVKYDFPIAGLDI